jgi:hypothetical protein
LHGVTSVGTVSRRGKLDPNELNGGILREPAAPR